MASAVMGQPVALLHQQLQLHPQAQHLQLQHPGPGSVQGRQQALDAYKKVLRVFMQTPYDLVTICPPARLPACPPASAVRLAAASADVPSVPACPHACLPVRGLSPCPANHMPAPLQQSSLSLPRPCSCPAPLLLPAPPEGQGRRHGQPAQRNGNL